MGSRARRQLRITFHAALHFGRRLLPPIAAVVTYLLVATLLHRWDLRRAGEKPGDFEATLYAVYRQLFFEPVEALPTRHVGRAIVWITPIVGLLLVAQGLVKVGAAIFEKEARREMWDAIMTDQMRGHVLVCGLGHVGYRVVEALRRLGEEVVCLESDPNGQFVEVVRSWGIPVHIGDARRDELLAKCGVDRARVVVCATSDDLANLEVAIDAKRMNPGVRVMMRMFDQRLAAKVGDALDLDGSFSTSALSAPIIALQATNARVLSAYRVGEQDRVLAEASVGKKTAGRTVSTVEEELGCRVVQRQPSGSEDFAPARASDVLAVGDLVIVDVAAAEIADMQKRLGA